MSDPSIPVVDVRDWHGDAAARARFVRGVGESLADIGFFALANHGIAPAETQRAYATAREFFALPAATKARYHRAGAKGQRGYTGFGTEHAKDAKAADLKEFWQVGRVDVPDDHEVHQPFGPNLWPDADVPAFQPVMSALYRGLDGLGAICLEAAALYLGEPADTFAAMATDSDTIVRVIYYPPTAGAPAGAVRSAAHEDINLITLLSGATADGLELLRRDGTWMPVHVSFDHIVVDSGDMLQNLTGWNASDVIVKSPQISLSNLVGRIYDAGRSKILHGTHVDRTISFADERRYATTLAGIALRGCVIRLAKYTGPDVDTAFRTIS